MSHESIETLIYESQVEISRELFEHAPLIIAEELHGALMNVHSPWDSAGIVVA